MAVSTHGLTFVHLEKRGTKSYYEEQQIKLADTQVIDCRQETIAGDSSALLLSLPYTINPTPAPCDNVHDVYDSHIG